MQNGYHNTYDYHRNSGRSNFLPTKAAEEVNVLVTGFEPLYPDTEPCDPSFLISQSLPQMLPSSHCHPSRIRILCHHEAIPASYPGVNDNISKLFTDRSRYDVVLHLGTGIYQSDYTIEKIARRDGYQTSEQDQSLPSKHERPEYQQSSPPKLETPARIPDVVARCKGEAPGIPIRVSTDAGLYLCEYLLFSSLALLHSQHNSTLPWRHRTIVAMMRLPPAKDEAAINKGRRAVLSFIWALVDSRRSRDGDFD